MSEETAEMTVEVADELLEQIADYEAQIKAAEDKRDALIERYQSKIYNVEKICEEETEHARAEIALLTEHLRRYAETQVTDKKRSVKLGFGTLSFRKQAPEFFFDDLTKAGGKDERLIKFVKHNAHEFLKVKVDEAVDWQEFKRQLSVSDNGNVFYAATGEVIEGLRAHFLPDKFTVKTS